LNAGGFGDGGPKGEAKGRAITPARRRAASWRGCPHQKGPHVSAHHPRQSERRHPIAPSPSDIRRSRSASYRKDEQQRNAEFEWPPAAAAAVGTKGGHRRTSSLRMGKMTRRERRGMPSRFGTERTLAASHHEINQVVVTSLIDYILNKNDLFVIVPKSDTCLRLAYIKIPLLQSPLKRHQVLGQ